LRYLTVHKQRSITDNYKKRNPIPKEIEIRDIVFDGVGNQPYQEQKKHLIYRDPKNHFVIANDIGKNT
tara:strand:+ start:391 stop:594 length:204 start_codon:yes stop_codon:yes gene_type:complete